MSASTTESPITTLVIAHRLSTIRHADRIVYIDHGRALEYGTHDELMQREGGKYRALIQQQHKVMLQGRESRNHSQNPDISLDSSPLNVDDTDIDMMPDQVVLE